MWKDWTNIVLGIWLAISPWLLATDAHAANPAMVWNCVLTGGGIAAFAGWASSAPKEVWQEWVVVLFGVWLLVAPGTLEYTVPTITWNNVVVGLVVAILAIWRIFKIDIKGV